MPLCGSKKRDGAQCRRRVLKSGNVCHCHQQNCSICLNSIKTNITTLPCNHRFHKPCIDKWKEEGKNTCPCCRKEFQKTQYSALVMLYPRNGRGQVTTLAAPETIIETLLRSVNVRIEELDPAGDTINLEFETNDDLVEFFDEVGLTDITRWSQ